MQQSLVIVKFAANKTIQQTRQRRAPLMVGVVRTLRARTAGRRIAIRMIAGASRRTTTRIKPTSAVKASYSRLIRRPVK